MSNAKFKQTVCKWKAKGNLEDRRNAPGGCEQGTAAAQHKGTVSKHQHRSIGKYSRHTRWGMQVDRIEKVEIG